MTLRIPALAFAFALLLLGSACGSSDSNDADDPAPRQVASADLTTTESGLQYYDFSVGDGAEATSGDRVTVHYRGWLTNGTMFDASYDRGEPFTFRLGAGQVIKGWDEGVVGMRVGGERRLRIPPELGYGDRGTGPIPGGATLLFDVELLEVESPE